MDDVLDADSVSGPVLSVVEASGRRAFLERQKVLLDNCYQGKPPPDANSFEKMLVELVHRDLEEDSSQHMQDVPEAERIAAAEQVADQILSRLRDI